MSLSAVVIWLAETIGKKKIGDLLETPDRRNLRSLQRALADAHESLDELAEVARLLARVEAQRDAAQREAMRLSIDNADLRREIAALKAAPTADA